MLIKSLKGNKILSVALISLSILSCTKDYTPIEYMKKVQSELRKEVTLGSYKFELQYKPSEYMALLEQGKDFVKAGEKLESKKYNQLKHFNFKLGTTDGNPAFLKNEIQDQAEYFKRLEFYISKAEKNFYLINDKDTTFPAIYHFERNYGLTKHNTIVLSFDVNTENNSNLLFVYDDKILGLGKIKIDINNIVNHNLKLKI